MTVRDSSPTQPGTSTAGTTETAGATETASTTATAATAGTAATTERTPTIRLHDITALHPSGHGLHAVSQLFPGGSRTVLAGANGSGKSTLLAVLAGTMRPQRGALGAALALQRTKRIGFVPQHSAIPAGLPLSVTALVSMGRWAGRRPWSRLTSVDRTIVSSALDALELGHLAERGIDALSGGQRQRALVARALTQQPALLLLDEPDASLDAHSRELIEQLISAQLARGVTVVQSSHEASTLARAARLVRLEAGRIVDAPAP